MESMQIYYAYLYLYIIIHTVLQCYSMLFEYLRSWLYTIRIALADLLKFFSIDIFWHLVTLAYSLSFTAMAPACLGLVRSLVVKGTRTVSCVHVQNGLDAKMLKWNLH